LDPGLLEEAITDQQRKGKKISAIIVVHLYGMPAKMDEIMGIANRHNIPIIEDAAEALGSLYHDKACGSMGKIGILSFNGNKIITTSGGGALASNDEEIMNRARHISAQAKEPAPFYLHKEVGYNYRLSNVCAGIGRGQMEVLQQRVERRREIFNFYRKELSAIDGIDFCYEADNIYSNRWLTTILINEKLGSGMNDRIRIALEEKEVETRPLWKPLHQQPVFKDCDIYLNGASDSLFMQGLCLPSGSNLTEENLKTVVHGIKDVLSSRK
jgi:dTDP-4-amino-4,6-dideoxygalactose transaminase